MVRGQPGWLLAALALGVFASATHLPHLPELLLGLHNPAHDAAATMAGADLVMDPPAWAAATASVEEVWCSVEGVPPVVLAALLALLVACAAVLAVLASARHMARSVAIPPPPVGSRLRAVLQVYRN